MKRGTIFFILFLLKKGGTIRNIMLDKWFFFKGMLYKCLGVTNLLRVCLDGVRSKIFLGWTIQMLQLNNFFFWIE